MGQKINPHIFRLQTVFQWNSRWFNEKDYKKTVLQDFFLRKLLREKLKNAGVSNLDIERSINSLKVIIYVARPGVVIGRAGTGLEELKKTINNFFIETANIKHMPKLDIRVEPIKEPNLDSYLVAKSIADQLEKRMPFKRIMVQTAARVMSAGALGVRIILAGRIAGAEIGRREKIQTGTVPLSTIRENIDYSSLPSLTKKGYIGVKVWIHKPEGK
jgi:small subunit ribosomal protein S3